VVVVAAGAPLSTAATGPSALGLLAEADVAAIPDVATASTAATATLGTAADTPAGVPAPVAGPLFPIEVAGPLDPLVGTGPSAPVDDGWTVAVDPSSAAVSF
jgi:hypothetical protein